MTPAFRYLFGWCKEHQVNKILNRIDQLQTMQLLSLMCSIGMFVDALIKIGHALYRQPNMQWHC